MRRWAVCDCETDPFRKGREVRPFIWGLKHDDGDELIFDGPTATDDFIAHISEFNGLLYAHNGGRFDFMFPEFLDASASGDEGDDTPIMLINNRIAKLKIGRCELRDSYLLLPVALSKLEKDTNFRYAMLDKRLRDKHIDRITEYLLDDCRGLHKSLSAFFERHGGQPLTLPGACLKKWENEYGGSKRRYAERHDAFFRQWYIGGRTQVFEHQQGSGPWEMYDINSSFPAAMCAEHPLGSHTTYTTTDDLADLVGPSFWIISAISRGCLPVRDKKGGISYPHDAEARYYTTTGWEIMAGLETGTLDIIEVLIGHIPSFFESMKNYVLPLAAEKLSAARSGDQIAYMMSKLEQNTLYGKYGSNPRSYKQYMVGEPVRPGYKFDKQIFDGAGGCHEIYSAPAENPQFFDVALAASITGLARANLWRAICAADHVVYCDTDSIICKSAPGLDIGDELGQWSHECSIDRLWIAGKKTYCAELRGGNQKVRSKGVRATMDQVKRAACGEVVTVIPTAPTMKLGGAQIFTPRRIKRT